jgi:predicted nucleotidyltransferase
MKTIADISLSEKDRKAIREAAILLRARFPIAQTILYGSKATGTDTDESDIDLLLVTTRPLSWRERDAITEALFDLQLAHDVVISTLVVPWSEWIAGRYTVLPIHDEIERCGAGA